MRIESIAGLVFRDPRGNEFGRIRALGGSLPNELQSSSFNAFAEDDCGNYFVKNLSAIGFWDHETHEVTILANSESQFLAGVVPPSSVNLSPSQVKSAWVDPEFAESLGLIKSREP